MEEIRDVPPARVGRVVQGFVDDASKTSVTCTRQPDGNWTVTAR